MEAPANNKLRQRKKKNKKGENLTGKEKVIPPREREKETPLDAETEREIPPGEKMKENPPDAERKKDGPPDDDICPICFGNYHIPCQTNCGHWFCANCVIAFWAYGSKLLRCKCPICSQSISKLTPEASLILRTENAVIEILKKVEGYNHLFAGGVHSLIPKLGLLPSMFREIYQDIRRLWMIFYRGLFDPDNLVLNYVVARITGFLLSVWYEYMDFDFLPGGYWMTRCIFECGIVALVLIFGAIGLYHKILANRRPPRRRRPRRCPAQGPSAPLVEQPSNPHVQGQSTPCPLPGP